MSYLIVTIVLLVIGVIGGFLWAAHNYRRAKEIDEKIDRLIEMFDIGRED